MAVELAERRRLRVATVVGTRPELIRLAPTIKLLDEVADQVLIHTGQNYDYELHEIFYNDLGLRRPDYFLGVDTSSLGATLGCILSAVESVLLDEKPDAFLILGDTNSCLSAIIAKRLKIPVYHMEAGNRCFDENVPEETNRRIIDHVADYNLVYTEHARRNLLAEGIHPSRILLTGSPMNEVLIGQRAKIESSDVLERENLHAYKYFLVSLHREETVDFTDRLGLALLSLRALREKYGLPILVSTHPRTRKRLLSIPGELKSGLVFHKPFGFLDYVKLQLSARLVLSDSGTISEESTLLGFPAITLRDFIERPEALDTGAIITSGLEPESVIHAVDFTLACADGGGHPFTPNDYLVTNTSERVVAFIMSTAHSHRARTGLRPCGSDSSEV